jgi:hypothetical protein
MIGLDNDSPVGDAAIDPVIEKSIFVMVSAVLNRLFGLHNSAPHSIARRAALPLRLAR